MLGSTRDMENTWSAITGRLHRRGLVRISFQSGEGLILRMSTTFLIVNGQANCPLSTTKMSLRLDIKFSFPINLILWTKNSNE